MTFAPIISAIILLAKIAGHLQAANDDVEPLKDFLGEWHYEQKPDDGFADVLRKIGVPANNIQELVKGPITYNFNKRIIPGLPDTYDIIERINGEAYGRKYEFLTLGQLRPFHNFYYRPGFLNTTFELHGDTIVETHFAGVDNKDYIEQVNLTVYANDRNNMVLKYHNRDKDAQMKRTFKRVHK